MNIYEILDLYSGEYIKDNTLFIICFILFTFIYYILEVVGIGFILSKLNNKINQQYVIYFLVLSFVLVVFTYIRGYLESKLSSDIATFSRKKFFKGLLQKYKTNYQDLNIGNSINRIFAVTLEYRFAVINFFKLTLPCIFVLILTTGIILKINFKIGLLLLACLFVAILITCREYKIINSHKISQEKFFYNSFNSLTDQVNNLMNSYLNNENKNEQNKIEDDQDKYKEKVFNAENSVNYINTYLMFNLMVFLSFIIYYFYKNKMSDKVFFVVVLIYFVSNYITLSKEMGILIPHLGISAASSDYFKKLLENNDSGKIKNIKNGNIEFKNVSFGYNNNKILNKLCFNIKNKSKVAIIGRSGSGKTTLTKLILKLYNDYDGTIYLGGQNIKNIDTDYLRQKVVYINQRTNLLETSVIDNINYGNHVNKQVIIELLKKYDLLQIFQGLKNGIYEICSVGGTNLSLGMQKVIILTRGILKSKNSNLMIFDEPLAGLDANTRQKVIKMIMNECNNNTLLIITHDEEIIPYMDTTLNLQNINKK